MLGKENWQQVLDSDEAKAIRTSAERAYSRRRKKNLPAVPWSSSVLVQDLEDLGRPTPEFSSVPNSELDRTWSNCTQTLRDCDYVPDYQCIQSFLEVVFPIQWGFFDLNRQSGRQWLFDLIVACEPIYHASCGMWISFESGLKAGSTSGQCDVTPQVRESRLRALQGLQPYISEMQPRRLSKSSLPRSIHAVAAILMLTSLEVFGEAEGAWEIHQNAAGAILDVIEMQIAAPGTAEGKIGSMEHFLRNSIPSIETRALGFFVATYVWADILAEAAHGMTYGKPRDFDYLPLLRTELIDTRSIMGCRTSVMVAIKEVSMFNSSTRDGQQAESTERGNTLAIEIRNLIQQAASDLSQATAGSDKNSSWVTLLHAYAALIYLQTVMIQQNLSCHLDIQETVPKSLEILETLPPWLFIRVCWPYTVTGCMASEGYYSRFRALIRRVEESGNVLGYTWKGLLVMEECWQLRRCQPEAIWCWRTTMEHKHTRILLI